MEIFNWLLRIWWWCKLASGLNGEQAKHLLLFFFSFSFFFFFFLSIPPSFSTILLSLSFSPPSSQSLWLITPFFKCKAAKESEMISQWPLWGEKCGRGERKERKTLREKRSRVRAGERNERGLNGRKRWLSFLGWQGPLMLGEAGRGGGGKN